MNSRDAAFDESLKELIEATAAEAAAVTDPQKPGVNGCTSGQSEVPDDDSNGRKKRKRGDDDACVQPASSRSDYSSHSLQSPQEAHQIGVECLRWCSCTRQRRARRAATAHQTLCRWEIGKFSQSTRWTTQGGPYASRCCRLRRG